MKRKSLKITSFFEDLIEILEDHQPNISISFALMCHCVHFLQILSYEAKSDQLEYSDPKLMFLSRVFYYANFVNVLWFFQSNLLSSIAFYGVFAVILGINLFFCIIFILKRVFRFNSLMSLHFMSPILRLIVLIITLFYWVFLIPILELYSNALNCTSFQPIFVPTRCSDPATEAISILALIITIISLFIFLWANRSHSFLESHYLRMKFNGLSIIVAILNVFLIIFFQYIDNTFSFMLDLVIVLIGFFWLYNVVFGSEFSNQKIHGIFLAFLVAFLTFAVGFFLKDNSKLLKPINVFYSVMMTLVFSIKFSRKALEKTNNHIFDSNFKDFKYLGVSLDNFYSLFTQKNTNEMSAYYFNGLFRNHFLTCKIPDCLINQHKFTSFQKNNNEDQARTVNAFVSEVLIRNLKRKDIAKSTEFEQLLLRYGSFITHKNMNAIKAIYELEHIMTLNKAPSMFFACVAKSLRHNLRESILEAERIARNNETEAVKKEIDVATFAYVHKSKSQLQRTFIEVLKLRQEFFEKFRDGFKGYDEMITSACRLTDKINSILFFLDEKIKKSKQNLLNLMLPLKFRSILSCVVLNQLNEGVKAEEELDKLRKREISVNKNMLTSLSFLDDNVLLIQASFLGSDGNLLESCKNEKLAHFFNYTLEECKSIKHISQFMPRLLRGFHQRLVEWYINKPRHRNTVEKPNFDSYAVTKTGLIFPIKLYVGPSFEYKGDFVFQATLLKDRRDFQGFIFDKNGDLHGFSQLFLNAMGSEFKEATSNELCLLNIFALMPNLKEILDKNKAFLDLSLTRLRNVYGYFYFPNNLGEIVSILKTKVKEEETARSHRSMASSRSNKSENTFKKGLSATQNSNSKNNSKFISKFFKTANMTNENKSLIQKRYLENNLTNYEILKELIDKHNSRKFKFNFDLFFHHHQLSETEHLQFVSFTLQKLAMHTQNENAPSRSINNLSFDDQKSGVDPTLIEPSEINTGFVNMPPPNVFEFREPLEKEKLFETPSIKKVEPEFITEGNHLFTTEGDQNMDLIVSKKNPEYAGIENFRRIATLTVKNDKNIQEHMNNDPNLAIPKEQYFPQISLNEISSNQEKKEENSQDSGFKSSDSKEKRQKLNQEAVKEKAKTSNEQIIDMNDKSSQNSSLSSLKRTFTIFNMMKLIQKHVPSMLYTMIFAKSLEVLMIIVYCIVLMVLSQQYIYSNYEPLEAAIVNFSNLYNGFSMATTIMIEVEMIRKNFSSTTANSVYFQLFNTSFTDEYINFKRITESERDKSNLHSYQDYFKKSDINVTHQIQPKFQIIPIFQFLDGITEMLNQVQGLLESSQLDFMECDYFINTFLPFQHEFDRLTQMIWQEFDTSNSRILSSVEDILIIFVIFILVVKIIDYYKLQDFYKQLVKILTIFIRTNQNETITEIIITNQMITTISDHFDKFLHINFADELFNRKTVKILDTDHELNSVKKIKEKDASKKKKTKISRRSYMNPLNRWQRISFLFFSYLIVFSYLFFNYYYWSIVNSEIKGLIDTTNFFQNMYTLPSSIIVTKNLIFRNKLISNRFSTQIDKSQQSAEFYNYILSFTADMQNTNKIVPNYALPAQADINDHYFTMLIEGDICAALADKNGMTPSETLLCQKVYNGAYTKGMMSASNEFANIFNFYTNSLNPNNTDLSEIISLIRNDSINDDISAIIYINMAMKDFYENVELYHKNAMFKQQSNLQTMLVVTTVIIGSAFLLVIFLYSSYLKRKYKNVSLVLSLIPYDRLMNDEQTVFLIKKYLKT